MDYSKMSDFEINKSVALALGFRLYKDGKSCRGNHVGIEEGRCGAFAMDWCNNPADAWAIIVENGITLAFQDGNWWADNLAYWVDGVEWNIGGIIDKNPLRAAMIVFLMMQESK